jgi:prevent-host-death family protein
MDKIIGLKDLRQNLVVYASKVKKGQSFVVVKRSKPLFKITPVDDGKDWETVVDFTEINPRGVPVEKVKRALDDMLAS